MLVKMFLPFLLLAFFFADAQNTTVTFSKVFSITDRGLKDKDGGFFKLGNFYYCSETAYKNMQLAYTAKLNKIKYGINLYKYDEDMKEINKIVLNNGSAENGPFPPSWILFNNKILVFYYQVQDEGSIKLRLSIIDPETFTEKENKDLYTINEKNDGFFKLFDVVQNNKLMLMVSADRNKLLVAQSGNTDELFSCIIHTDFTVTKSAITTINKKYKDFVFQDFFIDNAENKCFSYTYTPFDKVKKQGIYFQNNAGKDGYADFTPGKQGQEANELSIHASKDDNQLYVYGNYHGEHLEEGVALSTVNPYNFAVGSMQLFPYPDYLKDRLNKLGFGEKHKDALSVFKIDYTCKILDDGTVALTGYPVFSVTTESVSGGGATISGGTTPVSTHVLTRSDAGLIVNIFIKEGKCNYGLICRKQITNAASGYLSFTYNNKLVCIYTDKKQNVELSDTAKTIASTYPVELVLTKAVLNSDGTIASKEIISGKPPASSNYYFIDFAQLLPDHKYLIPIAREKMGFSRSRTELQQWATIDIK